MSPRAGPVMGRVGGVGVGGGICALFKVQPAPLLPPNLGEGRACSHRVASMEVKGKPFLDDNDLNLGSLNCWVVSQQILYGFFSKPRLVGF